MKVLHKHLLALCITTIYFVATLLLIGSCYCINDDRFMGELLSGAVTGKIETHLIYVNYLLSFPLSLFYHISTSIPWFGIMLLLFHFLSCYAILISFYHKARNTKDIWISTILVGVLFLSEIYLITRISYTITASFMAVAGFICLILNENKIQRYAYFILLEFLALLLRDKAMLMILPVGFTVFLGLQITKKNKKLRIKLLEIGKVISILLFIVVVSFAGNKIGYHNTSWAIYKEYNDARTTLFDYSQFPPYEEITHILDKHNVTRTDYEAYTTYTILDYKLSLNCIKELARYCHLNKTDFSISDILLTYKIKTIWDPYWGTNILMLICYACVIIFLLLSGHLRGLITMLFLMMARTAVWLYLIWGNRFPHRISMPLIACEILLLVTIAYHFYVSKNKYLKWQTAAFITLGLVFTITGIWSFKNQFVDLQSTNNVQKISMQDYDEILNYCNNNPEHPYILDALSFANYNAETLDGSIYGKQNFVMSSTWFSNSPVMLDRIQTYLGDATDGFYFIIGAKENEPGTEIPSPIVQYLAKESGSTPIISDTIITTHGEIFLVIYFDKTLKINTIP